MSDSQVRVQYGEGQILLAEDLSTEQAYRVAAMRRHRLGLHGWGVVDGLDIEPTAAGMQITPGVAVDADGREIVVDAAVALSTDWLNTQFSIVGNEVDVWLEFARRPFEKHDAGRSVCDPGRHSRTKETFQVRLSRASVHRSGVGTRNPEQATAGDSGHEGSVYLGRIEKCGDMFVANAAPRQHVVLYGERVVPPNGHVSIGWDAAHTPAEHFAVRAHKPGDDENNDVGTDLLSIVPQTQPVRERWPECATHAAKTCWVTMLHGSARVNGDVRLRQGSCGSQAVRFNAVSAVPDEAMPWTIYRAPTQVETEEEPEVPEQLRFEIGHPANQGDARTYRFVIGTSWRDALRVRADSAAEVHRDLTVTGRTLVIEPPIDADPTDPRFAMLSGQYWLRGVAAALGAVSAVSMTLVVVRVSPKLIEYWVKVTNSGTTPLTGVQLLETITGDPVSPTRLVTSWPELQKDETLEQSERVAHSFSPGSEVTLHLEVVGLGQHFNYARDRASQTIQIPDNNSGGQ